MFTARLTTAALVCALCFPVWAAGDDDGDKDRGKGDNRRVYQAEFVPIASLGVPIAAGTDPLKDGAVTVTARGEVKVTLEGAAANASYTASFCRFALTAVGCTGLTNGTFATNENGRARADMEMPLLSANWSGVFLIARNGVPQFATAFATQGPAVPAGAEIEIKGRIGALDPASNSFRLDSLSVPVFVTSRTHLVKFDSLGELRIGDRVEVRGVSTNGRIEATRIKSED
jgi:hypothetical protein